MDLNVPAATITNGASQLLEIPANGFHPGKSNQENVPKKVYKYEREKLKRVQQNKLFFALAYVLGLREKNGGKASILVETIRIFKEMHAKVEMLKIEQAALLSESRYVSAENNELQEENFALEGQIRKLKVELEQRAARPMLDLNAPPPPELMYQQAPHITPVYVIPICYDLLPGYFEPNAAQMASESTSSVSRPHARYLTPDDSWPSRLLGQQSQPFSDDSRDVVEKK